MPASVAPSLEALLDFESEWDRVLEAVCAGLPFPVNPAHGESDLVAPYITAVFSFMGESPVIPGSNQPLFRQVGSKYDGVTFRGRISFEIVVDRTKANGEQIRSARGGLRKLFLPSQAAFNSTALPWYDLAWVEVADAGVREVDLARDLDVTPIRYDIRFSIRPEAWPT